MLDDSVLCNSATSDTFFLEYVCLKNIYIYPLMPFCHCKRDQTCNLKENLNLQ